MAQTKFEHKTTKELVTVFVLCKQRNGGKLVDCTVYEDVRGNYFVCTTEEFHRDFSACNRWS